MNGCIYRTEENKCKQFSVGGVLSFRYLDGTCDCQIPSNADRIRAMTDKELATALYAGCSGRECPEGMWDNPLSEDEEDSLCLKCTIAWLKATVEVDNGTKKER